MDDSRALEIATRAARSAGALARKRLGSPGFLTWKGHRDVVSEAVLEIQDVIQAALLADAPGSAVLAEEGPDDAPVPVDASQLWIVDPVCGSLNFVQGIPCFGIAIAFRAAGNVRAGVVYDPCTDELFAATLDGVATLNGEKIVVQQLSDGIEAWGRAIVGTDWPRSIDRRRQVAAIVGVMADQVTDCPIMGSPALGICQVAAGRYHAYWHLDLKIWDIAAAALILQRAGGCFTDLEGMTWLYSEGGYIGSNAVVHNSTQGFLQSMLSAVGPGRPGF